jgi:hypothetical protein
MAIDEGVLLALGFREVPSSERWYTIGNTHNESLTITPRHKGTLEGAVWFFGMPDNSRLQAIPRQLVPSTADELRWICSKIGIELRTLKE